MQLVFETAFSQLNYPPGSLNKDVDLRLAEQDVGYGDIHDSKPSLSASPIPRSMSAAPPSSSVTANLLQNILVERYLTEYGHFLDPTLKCRYHDLVLSDLQNQAPYSRPAWMKSWWHSVVKDVYQEAPVMMATLRVTATNPSAVPEDFIRLNMPSTMHFVHAAATCGEYDWIKVFANIEDHIHHGTDRYAGIHYLLKHGRLGEVKARVDSDEVMLEARLFGQWELMVQPMQEAIQRFRQQHNIT